MNKLEKVEKIQEYLLDCISRNKVSENKYICPNCSNQLQVQFEAYARGQKKLLGIQVECHSCDIATNIDIHIDKAPKFLKGDHL